jgi:hypothetical protein
MLTPQQVSRIAAHGRRGPTARGDVLVEAADKSAPFFVVLSGELQALRPTETAEIGSNASSAEMFPKRGDEDE